MRIARRHRSRRSERVSAPLLHRLYSDPALQARRADFSPDLAALLGVADEPFVIDPARAREALIVGSAVVRAAERALLRADVASRGVAAFSDVPHWWHEVEGLAAGAVVSAGSRLDAVRLARHYALTDAVLVGSATVAAEGLPRNGLPGWRWSARTPLAFPALADVRRPLADALRATRVRWQGAGLLSARMAPALVVVTGARETAAPAWLAAPALRECEAWVLTSPAGAERLEAWRRAGVEGVPAPERVLCAGTDEGDESLAVAAVPRLLRERLDVRIAGHDGGRRTLAAFAEAGALHQLDVTFVGCPPVADSHPGRRGRSFFSRPEGPAQAPLLALLGADEDAWCAQFDARSGALP